MKLQSLLLTLAFALMSTFMIAQEVAKTIIVEHFTNTRCGICSARNPGFYDNLNNQTGVLHLAVHPSSPYSNCVLNQVNPVENDARTNYYGIYGSTPRLVIQGENISPGANYGDAAIFSPYQNETSPISIEIYQTKVTNDFTARVVLKAVADNAIGEASLFLPIAEDVVFYDAPNGEDEHYDVFRKTINDEPEGVLVDVPSVAGDSLELTYFTSTPTSWAVSNLYLIAILQNASDKSVLQAAASDPSDNFPIVTSTKEEAFLRLSLSPNPASDVLQIMFSQMPEEEVVLTLYNTSGARLLEKVSRDKNTALDISALPKGVYLLSVGANGNKSKTYKVIKQ